jgi:UDP-glucose 4-epimerase
MKALVTGGSGFIGSHLANALIQAGHAVRVLDLELPGREGPLDPGCEYVQGSVVNPEAVARAVRGVEAVYHLAWSFRAGQSYPESHPDEERQEIEENLLGTLTVLEAALTAGVQRFLFASSAVVYGPTGPTRVAEEHPCRPERSTIGGPVYGITKLACERLCWVYQQRGLPVTVLRLHGVFDAEHLGSFGPMIEQALSGEPVRVTREGGGEYAHLEDVLAALLQALSHPRARGETFNVAGTHTYHEPEVARYIVETARPGSEVALASDPTQGMVSVSVAKLRRWLGYEPQQGEFLTGLIRDALKRERREAA